MAVKIGPFTIGKKAPAKKPAAIKPKVTGKPVASTPRTSVAGVDRGVTAPTAPAPAQVVQEPRGYDPYLYEAPSQQAGQANFEQDLTTDESRIKQDLATQLGQSRQQMQWAEQQAGQNTQQLRQDLPRQLSNIRNQFAMGPGTAREGEYLSEQEQQTNQAIADIAKQMEQARQKGIWSEQQIQQEADRALADLATKRARAAQDLALGRQEKVTGARAAGMAGVANYAAAAGFRGDALVTAIAIAMAESSGDPEAVGDVGLQNATWGPSLGLWQVRSVKAETGKGSTRDANGLKDPYNNARSAYQISGGGKNFNAWTTYKNGAYKKYLDAARVAAGQVSGEGAAATWTENEISKYQAQGMDEATATATALDAAKRRFPDVNLGKVAKTATAAPAKTTWGKNDVAAERGRQIAVNKKRADSLRKTQNYKNLVAAINSFKYTTSSKTTVQRLPRTLVLKYPQLVSLALADLGMED